MTVRGVIEGTGSVLYSYMTFKAKDSGTFDVYALNVNGYMLTSGDPVTLFAADVAITHTFEYKSLATTVTIKAIDDDLGDPIPNFTEIVVPAMIGQPFSYNAPYILGWNLEGAVTKDIPSVTGSAD